MHAQAIRPEYGICAASWQGAGETPYRRRGGMGRGGICKLINQAQRKQSAYAGIGRNQSSACENISAQKKSAVSDRKATKVHINAMMHRPETQALSRRLAARISSIK